MNLKKNLASILTTLLLLTGTASFAQDDNTIYMDEDAFNEALSNAGGSLENLSENLQNFSNNVEGTIPFNGDQSGIPVDGGLGLLLAAGLGYGANRIRKQRNSHKTSIQ